MARSAFITDPRTGLPSMPSAQDQNWQRTISPANVPSYEQSAGELGFTGQEQPGVMDRLKGGLQNEGLMKGILGAGQLGLGVLSYLDQSKVADEQLKALKQNRQQAAANFQAQQQQRAAINSGFSSALAPRT